VVKKRPAYREKRDKDGRVIWRINAKTRNGYYRINKRDTQFKFCERVTLKGFDRSPLGLYSQGHGLTASGNWLLEGLVSRFLKKIDLTLVAAGKSVATDGVKKARVTIAINDLADLNRQTRLIRQNRNNETRSTVQRFLAKHFQGFSAPSKTPTYAAGTLAAILSEESIIDQLGTDDKEKLGKFIPEYLEKVPGTLRAHTKLSVVFKSLEVSRLVILEKVIDEFRRKLVSHPAAEATWQTFLSDYILLLRNNYGEVLTKESVSLAGKFPDFMLIDPYSYLDIYEIKTPATELLKFDSSRNNYYWAPELSKAISQVENYLYQIQRNSSQLAEDIRKNKGIDINIVRPRGYIIAGSRSQLVGEKMKDDLRILNDSLKNVDVILYDELLSNFEGFVKKLSGT